MKEYRVKTDIGEMMIDPQGRYVSVEAIKPVDLLRDETLRSFIGEVEEESMRLKELKAKVFKALEDFIALSASEYGVEPRAIKGNISFRTFNGEYLVKIISQDALEFDEQLQVAKELIDECLTDWCEGANAALSTVVKDAFKVDRKGRLDTRRILALRKLDIADERWGKAMDAIGNSISVYGRRRYVRFFRIEDGREIPISVNWNEL